MGCVTDRGRESFSACPVAQSTVSDPRLHPPLDATWTGLALAALGALCLGVSKTGFPGLAILNVLIMAELFGAKNSVGIILPMLVVCDLVVYPLFRRHASWREVWPLVPVTLVAVVAASFLLDQLDDGSARRVICASSSATSSNTSPIRGSSGGSVAPSSAWRRCWRMRPARSFRSMPSSTR
jgi:hypothetical protein